MKTSNASGMFGSRGISLASVLRVRAEKVLDLGDRLHPALAGRTVRDLGPARGEERGEMVTMVGMPISSASVSLTPADSSRSSYSTSTPAPVRR